MNISIRTYGEKETRRGAGIYSYGVDVDGKGLALGFGISDIDCIETALKQVKKYLKSKK